MYNSFIIFLAEDLQYLLIILLVIFGLRNITNKSKAQLVDNCITIILAGVSAIIARLGLKEILIKILPEARPYVADHNLISLIGPQLGEEMQSFPSGHALFYFAIATSVYLDNKVWGTIFYVGAILMGTGRVLANVHYTHDVMAGAIIGSVIAFVIHYIYYKKFDPKVKLVINSHINNSK